MSLRMADRVRAGAPISANLELITLLRQVVAQQQRTNQLLEYLANAKAAEMNQAAANQQYAAAGPRDR